MIEEIGALIGAIGAIIGVIVIYIVVAYVIIGVCYMLWRVILRIMRSLIGTAAPSERVEPDNDNTDDIRKLGGSGDYKTDGFDEIIRDRVDTLESKIDEIMDILTKMEARTMPVTTHRGICDDDEDTMAPTTITPKEEHTLLHKYSDDDVNYFSRGPGS